jgi:hypothetical protein
MQQKRDGVMASRYSVFLLLAGSTLGLAAPSSSGVGCSTYSDSLCVIAELHVAEQNVEYIQKMTRAFVEVADGLHVAENTEEMNYDIKKLEQNLYDLVNGNPSRNLMPPPDGNFLTDLRKLEAHFTPYKVLLEGNVATVNVQSKDILHDVEAQQAVLMYDVDTFLGKWKAYATYVNVPLPPEKEMYARWLLVYCQRLVKEAMFEIMDIKQSHYTVAIEQTEDIFVKTMTNLVEGSIVSGMPKEKKVCSLHELYDVKAYWEKLAFEVIKFRRSQPNDIDAALRPLDGALYELVRILENHITECPKATSKIDEYAWFNMIENVFKMRIYGATAVRTYLELAKGLGDAAYNKVHMAEYQEKATHAMHKAVVGDTTSNLPTAPEQPKLDALLLAESHWAELDSALKLNVQTNDYSTASLKMVSKLAKEVSHEMEVVGHELVYACKKARPDLESSVWELTERQLELVQEMANEALLVNLDIEAEAHIAYFKTTEKLFEDSHWKLLLGPADPRLRLGHRRLAGAGGAAESGKDLLSDDTVPATKEACILQIMRTVLVNFEEVSDILHDIIGNNTTKAEIALPKMEGAIAAMSTPLATAINRYHYHSTCPPTTLAATSWEASLYTLSNVPFFYQRALTEFSLIALDYSKTWLEETDASLASQEGYIAENSGDLALVDTFVAFKQAWESFRATPEERQVAAMLAYITLNPHPAGEKYYLDRAPGSEEYHAVHLKHHPNFRDILDKRHYGDIFLFDAEGNCMYSVKKELDFGTNFLANGEGEWKDSGLGRAFQAAMDDPRKVHVIDWAPYAPAGGKMVSFLSKGVMNSYGTIVGVYCTEMPPDSMPRYSDTLLADGLKEEDDILWDFKFGKPKLGRPTPPTQLIADRLFNVVDAWAVAKPMLEGSRTLETLESLVATVATSEFFLGDGLVQTYTDVVQSSVGGAVPSRQIYLAGQQLALLQGMCTEALWIAHQKGGSTAHLSAAMANFSQAQVELRTLGYNAGGTRRARRLVSESDLLLDSVDSKWSELEPSLQNVVSSSGFGTGDMSVKVAEFIKKTEGATHAVGNSLEYFGSTTRTTTLAAVNILAPMPMTGSWAGGRTMEVAALLAEKWINADQEILKGFDLHHKFYDDKCESTEIQRLVLEEMAIDDTYVALGGVGCSHACAASTFVASTLNLPFLSYNCPSPKLSDAAAYPGLTRVGTITINDRIYDTVKWIGENYSWSKITIVSSDDDEARADAELIENGLIASGLAPTYELGINSDFDQLKSIFTGLKESARGELRNVFVVGSESFYRRLLCASVMSEAKEGITWISQGSWRDSWWNKSDMSLDFQHAGIREEAESTRLQEAVQDFSAGWDAFDSSDAKRMDSLRELYITGAKEKLLTIPGEQLYHKAHRDRQGAYTALLSDRDYNDIYFFDIRGNLLYSVYKHVDFGTNFATGGGGKYEDSGLGRAFREALAEPNEIHFIDFADYEPIGAQAAFFATGIINASTGETVGVYAIQLPPTYVQSVDKIYPEECSLTALKQSYEGAINIGGLGKPVEEYMERPLACFKGHSASSFYFELDKYLQNGVPGKADPVTNVYSSIRGNAADATCVIAFTLKHMLSVGYSLEQLQHPTAVVFDKMKKYMKEGIDFAGATGQVTFVGNDKPGNLVVQQVQQGVYVEVGVVDEHGNRTWLNGGVIDTAWQKEDIDAPPPKAEEFNIFSEVILPFFFVIIPILLLLALSPLLCLVVLFIAKNLFRSARSE